MLLLHPFVTAATALLDERRDPSAVDGIMDDVLLEPGRAALLGLFMTVPPQSSPDALHTS